MSGQEHYLLLIHPVPRNSQRAFIKHDFYHVALFFFFVEGFFYLDFFLWLSVNPRGDGQVIVGELAFSNV